MPVTRTKDVLVSPHDSRDIQLENLLASTSRGNAAVASGTTNLADIRLPDTLDYRPDMDMVYDQANTSACVAYSACAVKYWQHKQKNNESLSFNPFFIYEQRSTQGDTGMYVRDALSALYKKGIATKQEYKFTDVAFANADGIAIQATETVLKAAGARRISGYASISSIDGVKRALYQYGPCLVVLPVFNDSAQFWLPTSIEESTQELAHCVVIVGYTKKGFILRNHWGNKWANRGYTLLSYEKWGIQYECWCVLDQQTVKHPMVSSLKNKVNNTTTATATATATADSSNNNNNNNNNTCIGMQILQSIESACMGSIGIDSDSDSSKAIFNVAETVSQVIHTNDDWVDENTGCVAIVDTTLMLLNMQKESSSNSNNATTTTTTITSTGETKASSSSSYRDMVHNEVKFTS